MEIKTHEELIGYVQKSIDEKVQRARESAIQQTNQERELIEKAISLINAHLLYKTIKEWGRRKRYVLATPEMFYEDYVKEPENQWDRGLKFSDEKDAWYKGSFILNGEKYLDMRYIINKYEKSLEDTAQKLSFQLNRVHEIQREYEETVDNWPEIKRAVAEWNKIQSNEAH